MDIYQLKTFVAVAREGTITRAAEFLHLSQPAVSAHIKAIEDEVGLALFERSARGMTLTAEGQRLVAKAEQTLLAHHDFVQEATRLKGELGGPFRLGVGANINNEAAGKVVATFAERYPAVEVTLKHGSSNDILSGLRNSSLDAGFYNDAGDGEPDLTTIEVSTFRVVVAAPFNRISKAVPVDWQALAEFPWIYPPASACCGRTAENLFKEHRFRPKRIMSVDREHVTRTLIASGVGVGLLHEETAIAAQAEREVEIVHTSRHPVRILFACLTTRSQDPLLRVASALLRH